MMRDELLCVCVAVWGVYVPSVKLCFQKIKTENHTITCGRIINE